MFKKPVLPEVERVKLKPYKGIRPAYYILFTYFIIALVLFFILCLLPGLVSNKAYVSFSSDLPLYGVYEFKRGFGGNVIEYIGEFTLPITKFNKFYNFLRGIKRMINK